MSLARNWGNSDDEDFEDELFPEKPSSVPKPRTKKPSVSSKTSKKSNSVNSLPTGGSQGESANVSETTSDIDADLDMIFNTTVYGYVRPINDDGSFNVALPIDLEEVTIGRQKQCTLCIQSKTVSRVHAKLSCGADGVCWLECLTDKPVLVDQARLQLNERVKLYHDSTFTISSFSFCFEYPRNMQKSMRKPKAKKPTTKPTTTTTPSPPVGERTAPPPAQRASAAAKHPEPADTPDDVPQVEPEEVSVTEDVLPSTSAKSRGRGRPSTKSTQLPAQAPVKDEEPPAPASIAPARRSSARAAAVAASTPRGRAISRKNSQPVADTITTQSPVRSTADSSDADSSVSLSAHKPARPRMKSVPRSSKSSVARAEAALSAKERRQREEEEEMARLQASFQVTHSSRRTTNSSRTPAPLYFDEFPVVRKSNRKRKAEEVEVDAEAGTDAGADAGVVKDIDNTVVSQEEPTQPPQSRHSGRGTRTSAKSAKAAKVTDAATAADLPFVVDSNSSEVPDATASKETDVATAGEYLTEGAASAGASMDDGVSFDTAGAHSAADTSEATEAPMPMDDVDAGSVFAEEHDVMHDSPASTQPVADAPSTSTSPAKAPKTLAAGADVTVMQVVVEEVSDTCPLAAVAAEEIVDAAVESDTYMHDAEDDTCVVTQVPLSPAPVPVSVEDVLNDTASADAQAFNASLSNGTCQTPANTAEDAADNTAIADTADISPCAASSVTPSPAPAATQNLSLTDVPATIPSQDDNSVAVHFDSPMPTQTLSPAKLANPAADTSSAVTADVVVPSSQLGFLGDSQDDAPPAPLWVDVPRMPQAAVSTTNSPIRPRRYSSVADVNAQVLSQRKRVRTVVRMRRFSLSRPASVTEEVQVVQPSPARLLGAMRRLQEASVDDTAALVAATQTTIAVETANGEEEDTSSSIPAEDATDAVPRTVEADADVEAELAALLRAEKESVLAPAIAALEAVVERCGTASASRTAAVMGDCVADVVAANQANEVAGAQSTDAAPLTSPVDQVADAADAEDDELAGLDLLHAHTADSSDMSLLESLQAMGLDMSVADAESVTDALVRVVGAVGLRGEEAVAQEEVLAQLRAIPVGQAMLVQEEVDEADREAGENADGSVTKSDEGDEMASLTADVSQQVKAELDAAVRSPPTTPAARLLSPRVKSPFFSPRPADASMVTSPRMSLTLLAEPSALDLVQVLARAEAALSAAEEEAAAEAAAEDGGDEENGDDAEEDMDIDMSLESVRGVDPASAATPANHPAAATADDESLADEDLDDLKTATLNLSFAGEPTATLSPLRQRRNSGRYRVVRAGGHSMLDDDDDDEEDDIAKAMAAVGALNSTVMAPAVDLYADTTARADTTELDSSAASTFDDSDGLFSALARTAPSMRAHAQLPMTTHTHGYHPTLGYDDEDDFTSRLALQVVSEIADAFAKPLAPAAATPARPLPPSRTGLGTPARGIPLRERGTPLRDSHAAFARASHPLATPRRGTLFTPAKPPSARATPARVASAHPTPSRAAADATSKLTTPARRVPVQTPLKSAMRTPLREPLRMQTPARATATPSRINATPRSLRPTPLPRVALLPPKHVTHKVQPTPSSRARALAATPRPLPTPLRRGVPGSSRAAATPKVAAAKAEVDFLRCQLLTTLISPRSQPTLKPSPLAEAPDPVVVGTPVPVSSSPDATQPNHTPQRLPKTPTHHSTQSRTGRATRQLLLTDSDNEEEELVGRRLDMGDEAVEASPNSIPVVTDYVLQAFSPSNAHTRIENSDSDATGLVHVTRRRR